MRAVDLAGDISGQAPLLHLALVYIKIRIDLLDVIVVVDGVVELHHRFGVAAFRA